jgi:hypothetical protein
MILWGSCSPMRLRTSFNQNIGFSRVFVVISEIAVVHSLSTDLCQFPCGVTSNPFHSQSSKFLGLGLVL